MKVIVIFFYVFKFYVVQSLQIDYNNTITLQKPQMMTHVKVFTNISLIDKLPKRKT